MSMMPTVVKNPSMKNLPFSSVKDRNFKRCSQLALLIFLLIENFLFVIQ